MAHVTKIWDAVAAKEKAERAEGRVLLSQEDDLLIALNLVPPGVKNEFHFHQGTTQSFLCVKGKLTVRTKEEEGGEPTSHHLTEGMCILIPGGQYYQYHNESDQQAVLYQVKKPGDRIVVEGKGALNNRDYFRRN